MKNGAARAEARIRYMQAVASRVSQPQPKSFANKRRDEYRRPTTRPLKLEDSIEIEQTMEFREHAARAALLYSKLARHPKQKGRP